MATPAFGSLAAPAGVTVLVTAAAAAGLATLGQRWLSSPVTPASDVAQQ
jgi:hypothetical protein